MMLVILLTRSRKKCRLVLGFQTAATVKCNLRREGKVRQKGTEWVFFIVSSHLKFELERIGAPFACLKVDHGALREGHVILCVYQDHRVSPEWAGEHSM